MPPSHRQLAVLSISEARLVADALAAIDRLEASGTIAVHDAALVERGDAGAFTVTAVAHRARTDVGTVAFAWFLEAMLAPDGDHSCAGLSESMRVELREVLPTACVCLALLVSQLDPGAAVAEFREFPGTRLVYGALPDGAFAAGPAVTS